MQHFNRPSDGAPWCPACGAALQFPSSPKPWPWRIRNKDDLLVYVEGIEAETVEWLLCFYVAADMRLIAVEQMETGEAGSCSVDPGKIICRGRQVEAAGFILVHNHPSGRAEPSRADMAVTKKLRRLSDELGVPLLDHFIVAGKEIVRI